MGICEANKVASLTLGKLRQGGDLHWVKADPVYDDITPFCQSLSDHRLALLPPSSRGIILRCSDPSSNRRERMGRVLDEGLAESGLA